YQVNITEPIIEEVEELQQLKAEINKPVTWIKSSKDKTISIPEYAFNLSINKIINNKKQTIEKSKIKIEHNEDNETEVIIDETADSYEIVYETYAPVTKETELGAYRKQIIVSSEIHYTDVLTYTTIPEVTNDKNRISLYHLSDNERTITEFEAFDTDNNSLIDKIQWIVPHLSNQTYELIIEISKAEHLDENRSFISDIYNEVKTLDDVWSEPIYQNEYVRVTFNRELDSSRDITIYPRMVGGNPR
ncbi:unnamed protein product, partial [marine sediment metagenome]